MQNEHEPIILNRPRQKRRGLSLNMNGRITLRSFPVKLLRLERGDKIIFFCLGTQMYVAKSTSLPDAIPLYGRKGQLHGCSSSTVKCLFRHTPGIPPNTKEIDLVVSDQLESVKVSGTYLQALAVVNRADASHCRQ